MRHLKRYVLVLTAWVLVLVTFLATPASAAEIIYISDYLVESNSDKGKLINTYYYILPSISSGYQNHGWYFAGEMKSGQNGLNGHSDEVILTRDYIYYNFSSFPLDSSSSDKGCLYFDGICNDSVSSIVLTAEFYLYSSVPVSGWIRCTGNIYGSVGTTSSIVTFQEDKIPFSIKDSAIVVTVPVNFSDYSSSFDYISNLTYTIRFDNVPSGATISYSLADCYTGNLDPGLLLTTSEQKPQEAPVFTKNLTTPSIVYLLGNSPNPLSVTATVSDGGVISYQWYKSVSSTSAGTPISGATGNLYYPDTSYEHEGYYYCVATSTLNGETKSTVSNIVHLSVVKLPLKPQIVNDLNDGAVIEYTQGSTAGNLLFGCVVTDGGTLSYQWYEKSSASSAGSKISGATASTYKPPTDTIGIKYYYCVATNKKGIYSESVTSGLVGVRIISPPDPARAPVINSDLPTEPFTYTEGDAASPLRIGASSPDGGVLSYQWYEIINGSGKSIPGEIYATFTPDTVAPGTHQYYCIVTNSLEHTFATASSSVATVVIEEDNTDSLLGSIAGGISDLIDGILSLPQKFIDGIKGLFVPDSETMAGYQDRWFSLLASRFGAIYEAVMLIDEFGQAISDQAARGVVDFPQVTINLAGTPFVFGGWQVDVVPDGFEVIFDALKLMIDIVATLAFVNGLRHRFEGILGGE